MLCLRGDSCGVWMRCEGAAVCGCGVKMLLCVDDNRYEAVFRVFLLFCECLLMDMRRRNK